MCAQVLYLEKRGDDMQIMRAVSFLRLTEKEREIHNAGYNAGYSAAIEDCRRREEIKELAAAVERQRVLCSIKQIVIGLLLTVIGVAAPFYMDGDATASLLLVPMGLGLVFTRKIVIYDNSVERLRRLRRLKKEREVTQ